ncbi:MAG: hypothetical protein N2606_02945, partial [Candidatus Omnitrophica bacterium]|nr:hypothetical protein [Candidatus Omnitrophota bacterium]
MNYLAFSSITILVTSIVLGILVFLKSKNRRLARLWAGFCSAVAIWGLGGLIISLTRDYQKAFWGWQIGFCGIIFIPVFYFHFVYELTSSKRQKLFLITIYLVAVLLVSYNLISKEFIGSLRFRFGQFFWIDWWVERSIIFLIFYLVFYGFLLVYAFFKLFRQYSKSQGLEKIKNRYLLIGSVIGWIGGESNFLLTFGIDIYPYFNLLISLYTLIFAYAIFKYRLMDIRIALTRVGVFAFIYSLVLGFPFLMGYFTKSWFLSTSLAVVLATFGPFIYSYISRRLEDLLLAEQRRYQRTLRELSKTMVRIRDLEHLVKAVLLTVVNTVKVSHAAVYLRDEGTKAYKLKE